MEVELSKMVKEVVDLRPGDHIEKITIPFAALYSVPKGKLLSGLRDMGADVVRFVGNDLIIRITSFPRNDWQGRRDDWPQEGELYMLKQEELSGFTLVQ